MDKSKKDKATITIKINGEEKQFQEELVVHDWKEAKTESAASAEALEEDESFDWVLPDEGPQNGEEIKEFKQISYVPAVTKKTWINPRQKQSGSPAMLVSILLAVLTGLLLGYVMLHLFTSKDTPASSAGIGEQTSQPDSQPKDATGQTMVLKAFSVPIIQAGVFENGDSAESISSEVHSKGFPAAVIQQDGKYYLLAGVAGSVEDAKQAGNDFKNNQIDVYAKSIEIPSKTVDGVSESEKAFLNDSGQLFLSLSQVAGNASLGNTLDSDSLDKLEEKYPVLKNGVDKANKKIAVMGSQLKQSFDELKKFSASKDQKSLFQAQQSLLDFLKGYMEYK
ncbi:SPOR domain-containing protein [Falsibacillus albus]|uniref:SPOR domain-containing protein n=1 Tax=Falsibacillus albus TaxID=2478915 RepID=UPI0013143E48|nr:SPOR domain-containing protein [Falsibacillus albus]